MPTVEQINSTTDTVDGKPVAFVAAFFALCFLALFILYLRTSARNAKDHAAELLKLAIRFEHLSTKSFEVMHDLRDFLPRKKRRKQVDPTQVTVLDAEAASEPDKD